MKITKKINNNVAMGIDQNNREVMIFGRGIGFHEIPYTLEDVSVIERLFYNVTNHYIQLVQDIPCDILGISADIVDFAKKRIDKEFSPNVVFTLADHINFSIERYKNHIDLATPFSPIIKLIYGDEMKVGAFALQYIYNKTGINLGKSETYSIAMHFINAESTDESNQKNDDEMVQRLVDIVERNLNMAIDKESFNYSRFVIHLKYLLERKGKDNTMKADNHEAYELLRKNYQDIADCIDVMRTYIADNIDWKLSEDESLYLLLHLVRMCDRENYMQENKQA